MKNFFAVACFGLLLFAAVAAEGQGQNFPGGAGSLVATPTQGYEASGSSTGQIITSASSVHAEDFCGAGGFSSTLGACVLNYDGTHSIGHGACQAVIAAIASQGVNVGYIDARAFTGTQFIDSNCGVTLSYGGTANSPGSTVNGKVLWGNATYIVDGPTTLPFFTDGAVSGTPSFSGPSTWGTPGFLLANQFTGFFGVSKDASIFVPCSTTTTGCVHDWPSRSFPITSTSVAGNTMTITVTGTLLATGNPSAIVTSFTGTSGTLSFTNSGTNNFYSGFQTVLFGFTGANVGLNGQTVTVSATGLSATTFQATVTGSGYSSAGGYASEQNIYPTGGGLTGEYAFLVGSSLDNNNSYYIVKTVPTSTTITVGVPTGATSCASNCGTLWLGTAMHAWGMQIVNQAYIPQQGGAGLQSFAQRLEDIGIYGGSTTIPQGKSWPYGFIAMQNSNAGEHAGASHIQCDYIAGMCLDLHGGSTDSGPWDNLRMTNLGNNNAVRSTVGFGVAGAIRGIYNSSVITPYPVGTLTTSAGALGGCTTNCAQQVSGTNFATMLPNTQINIAGTLFTISVVNSTSILTLTTNPGTQTAVAFQYGQPLACIAIDGQGPTANLSPVFLANHPEACADGYRLAANYSVRGVSILGFLGGPSGGHANVNLVHAVAAGNLVLGSAVMGVDTQASGATATVQDDINGNSCLDLPLNSYQWDPSGIPMYSCKSGTFATGVQTMNGIVHSYNATKSLTVDSASITATTPATSTTVFTFSNFIPNVTLNIHCSGTTTQATAGAGIGIAFQTATVAAATELHASVATGPAASAYQSSGTVSGTSANVIYAGSTGTLTTQLPWTIDGSITLGATVPSALNIAFYSINASDGVVVKANSTCAIR
jgi:hypothetical protein